MNQLAPKDIVMPIGPTGQATLAQANGLGKNVSALRPNGLSYFLPQTILLARPFRPLRSLAVLPSPMGWAKVKAARWA